jgi:signal peptidase II
VVVLGLTAAIAGFVGTWLWREKKKDDIIALGLVLGGALGNLGDRLFRAPGMFQGHVVDMISLFGPYAQYFAIFNVADSCLSVGVVLAVLLELTGHQRDGSRVTKKEKATT